MPDDPIEDAPGGRKPEDKLRDLFDEIEREAPKADDNSEGADDLDPLGDMPLPKGRDVMRDLPDDFEYALADGANDDNDLLSDEERQLREFEKKLQEARNSAMPDPPEWSFTRPKIPGQSDNKDSSGYVGLGVGISVGYTMIGCVILGWGAGKLIDLRSDGMLGQGIGILVGAVVGLVGGIAMIIRAQKKNPNS
jgi:hypothetical protein